MGLVVDLHQAGGVDRRVGLGGRQRSVAQQFLDRAQVAAGIEQMRGKAVTHGMGCGRGGQAKLHPDAGHEFLHRAGRERAATGAAEKRRVGLGRVGTGLVGAGRVPRPRLGAGGGRVVGGRVGVVVVVVLGVVTGDCCGA